MRRSAPAMTDSCDGSCPDPADSRLFVETLLRPAAEKDGGPGLLSPGSVAELHTGLEVRLPGQPERRGLHPGGGVCHRSRRPGSATRWRLGVVRAGF